MARLEFNFKDIMSHTQRHCWCQVFYYKRGVQILVFHSRNLLISIAISSGMNAVPWKPVNTPARSAEADRCCHPLRTTQNFRIGASIKMNDGWGLRHMNSDTGMQLQVVHGSKFSPNLVSLEREFGKRRSTPCRMWGSHSGCYKMLYHLGYNAE
jgi:hypothetical protein